MTFTPLNFDPVSLRSFSYFSEVLRGKAEEINPNDWDFFVQMVEQNLEYIRDNQDTDECLDDVIDSLIVYIHSYTAKDPLQEALKDLDIEVKKKYIYMDRVVLGKTFVELSVAYKIPRKKVSAIVQEVTKLIRKSRKF